MTRANFGCGSSREHAPWALEVNGIQIVVAEGFARIFRQNMYNCGMIATELSAADIDDVFKTFAGLETELSVDMGAGKLSFAATGKDGKKVGVVSTINGDANVGFYKELAAAGVSADDIPVMAFSVGEEELSGLDTANLVGHLAACNYFESADTPENTAFIEGWHAFTGDDSRVTNDPMEATMIGFNAWVAAVEKAGSTDTDAVLDAIVGVEVPNLTGGVAQVLPNHHLTKPVLIGEIREDGQFDIVSQTEPVAGDAWTDFLPDSAVLDADWPGKTCGMFNTQTKTCVQVQSNY